MRANHHRAFLVTRVRLACTPTTKDREYLKMRHLQHVDLVLSLLVISLYLVVAAEVCWNERFGERCR
jgi:hypothetical protein